MFRSARVKLTLFYLAILLAFSLSVTGTIRVLAEREYDRSNTQQRDEVKHLFSPFLGEFQVRQPNSFYTFQDDQAALVRQHLNQQLVMINIAALAIGGLLSYWFAGRTLRPIEEAHEAQARFAADASHELRTPLTNLQLENELFLRQKSFSKDEARALIGSNLEEVQRLAQLSASLLELTRLGKTTLDLQAFKLQDITKQALDHVAKQAHARQVTIKQHLPGAVVMGDRESLTQLLDIVLDNALKYGPEKGTVTISGQPDGRQYVLTVADEGPGIADADLPFIFDRLYRGDKARSGKVTGYGLGLALAREIARANRAAISAHNGPEGGARFEVRLALAS